MLTFNLFQKPQFNWTSTDIGFIIGMDPVGTMLTFFTGTVIHKTGGVTFYAVGKLGEAILALIAPLMIETHLYLFMANKLMCGFFEV